MTNEPTDNVVNFPQEDAASASSSSSSSSSSNHVPAKNVVVQPYIEWVDGKPVRRYKPMIVKQDVQQMKMQAAEQIYYGDWDPINQEFIPDPRYEGLTKIEVAQHKLMDKAAAGDTQALQQIENRILGMPRQQVESLNVNATLESFLEKVAKDEGMVPPSDSALSLGEDGVIEAEVVGSSVSSEPSTGGMDI